MSLVSPRAVLTHTHREEPVWIPSGILSKPGRPLHQVLRIRPLRSSHSSVRVRNLPLKPRRCQDGFRCDFGFFAKTPLILASNLEVWSFGFYS